MDLPTMYLKKYCSKSELMSEEIVQWLPIIAGARLSEYLPQEKSKYLLDLIQQNFS